VHASHIQTFEHAYWGVLQDCVPQGLNEFPDNVPIAGSSYCSCNCCCCNTGAPAGTSSSAFGAVPACLLGVYDLGEGVQPAKAVFVMLLYWLSDIGCVAVLAVWCLHVCRAVYDTSVAVVAALVGAAVCVVDCCGIEAQDFVSAGASCIMRCPAPLLFVIRSQRLKLPCLSTKGIG
jgi:hypothetical protein